MWLRGALRRQQPLQAALCAPNLLKLRLASGRSAVCRAIVTLACGGRFDFITGFCRNSTVQTDLALRATCKQTRLAFDCMFQLRACLLQHYSSGCLSAGARGHLHLADPVFESLYIICLVAKLCLLDLSAVRRLCSCHCSTVDQRICCASCCMEFAGW